MKPYYEYDAAAHVLPATWGDDWYHVLDESCWCGPLRVGDRVCHRRTP